jgi:dynein heavy chain
LIEKLNKDKVTCEKRLVNASKLLNLLGSEGERWKEEITLIKDRMKKFVGDVFVSSSQMSYLGPFTGQYREPLIAQWIEESINTNI